MLNASTAVMVQAMMHTRNTMGYIEKSWEVPRWLLAQRLFRRKVGRLSVGWFMFQLAMSLCWHFSLRGRSRKAKARWLALRTKYLPTGGAETAKHIKLPEDVASHQE